MLGSPSAPLARQARLLSRTLRAIKKERRMTSIEVALSMGVALRTYQDFEKGKGDFDLWKIRRFAKATRSDAIGIVLAVMYGNPAIALITMRSKLLMTGWIGFRELWRTLGDRLHLIPAAQILLGLRKMGEHLQEYLDRRAASLDSWLETSLDELYEDPGEAEDER
ncbi:XRE family transcriptional regulator [Caulobacter segnis]|uniref:Helix-turn-helix domain-containing protein n=2 Tax=Caulobacter segnis TaxID=88688 RepID=D5VKK1_CAUST|nr:helix-turn-helix transcriptional regulator [Caulobacter segnis]ADG11024.1 helix-turn-helix domain-containing protein [Caulobacter segnis ATCC 21756]AVQ02713.1 XRE family transcriptional regulator [Caulobacter segnis]